ncbi:MAG TPA: hypothetical protein VGD21_06790 [Lysobacter sp.]
MQPLRPVLALFALLAGAHAAPTLAAEAYDNCTGFIDSLPASISTQGTWCLRKHLFTSMTSGVAITLANDNITIDCNNFRLSGYGAGVATNAQGVAAGASRQNATIRQCRIQGFKYGVALFGAGHLVEDNRFDGNTYVGILANGDHHVVRRNIIHDTGGRPDEGYSTGIVAATAPASLGIRVLDNTIDGVSPAGNGLAETFPKGIDADGVVLVQRNRIGGLVMGEHGQAIGIELDGRTIARDNELVQNTATEGVGIWGASDTTSICRDNDIQGYSIGIADGTCLLAGNNVVQP